MNKYQEALNYLDWHCNVEHKEQQDLLQELIDRETPMKPYYPNEYPSACCRKCFQNLGDNNYCRNCGQRVLWED